ncbi:MAG: MarC family protein [Deltaproteobacteria bacterium]|nr:MarC family protein [Deltaproteobacteria bacterium]MBW1983295.1 MarC family protein [Deltaproteobacteria bacterium]MBW2180469.1 MarC family protein [Deltaproteobacteria bacterium]
MNIEILINALAAYFVIVDPIGAALIFHSLTSTYEKKRVIHMALRTIVISLTIIFLFGFYGEPILLKLGITIEAIKVSGGLLLFYTAFRMIVKKEITEDPLDAKDDISVYPMSIPLIAGPGCLTLTILLFSEAHTFENLFSLVLAVLLIFTLTLIAFIFSNYLRAIIRKTGDDILKRLLGIILAALSVQFIADGIKQIAG